jgi:hypothetical protein
VILLAAPPRASAAPPQLAVPVAATPGQRTPTPVSTATPTADGVVIRRPAVMMGGAPAAGAGRPGQGAAPAPGPVSRTSAGEPSKPPVRAPTSPGREAPIDSIFGEDLMSEKSLDEVILAYLAEDAKHPK